MGFKHALASGLVANFEGVLMDIMNSGEDSFAFKIDFFDRVARKA